MGLIERSLRIAIRRIGLEVRAKERTSETAVINPETISKTSIFSRGSEAILPVIDILAWSSKIKIKS